MNTLLTLRGKSFTPKSAKGRGSITIPADSIVTLNHLNELYTSLERVKEYWSNNTIIDGVLVSVYYNRVLAKSNRIDGFLMWVAEMQFQMKRLWVQNLVMIRVSILLHTTFQRKC